MDVPANVVLNILKEEKCVSILHEWSNARHESKVQGKYMLSQYNDHAKIIQNFLVKTTSGGYSLLTWRDTGEEVVLDVCGLITMCSLPPLGRRGQTHTSNFSNRAHSISLVGPDCAQFAEAVSARKKIYKYFQDTIREGDLRPAHAYNFGDLDGIQAETRYLTPASNNVFGNVALDDSNDPSGVLRRMTSSGKLVYTEDNVITFATIAEDTDESLTMKEAHPGIFRRGQLVEASMSFRTVIAGPKHSFLTKLDSVLLVNRVGADAILDYQESHQRQSVVLPPKISIPKRRRFDDLDQFSEENEVMKRAKRVHGLNGALPPSDVMLDEV